MTASAAPRPPIQARPHVGNWVMRRPIPTRSAAAVLAAAMPEAAFYAYAYPQPPGLPRWRSAEERILERGIRGILPYDAVGEPDADTNRRVPGAPTPLPRNLEIGIVARWNALAAGSAPSLLEKRLRERDASKCAQSYEPETGVQLHPGERISRTKRFCELMASFGSDRVRAPQLLRCLRLAFPLPQGETASLRTRLGTNKVGALVDGRQRKAGSLTACLARILPQAQIYGADIDGDILCGGPDWADQRDRRR